MTAPARTLALLVRVRERRQARFDDAVKAAELAHQRSQQATAEAREVETAADAAHQQERDAATALECGDQPFDIEELLIRRHLTSGRQHALTQARSHTQQQQQDEDQKAQRTQQERRNAMRNRRRTDNLRERLKQVKAALALAADDQTDEESEEAAVARRYGSRR